MQSYIPQGNSSQEDKAKEISQLPGMGGIYNTINSHLYHYAGNNPVKYVDPDGEAISIGIAIAFSAAFLASYYSVLPIIKNNIEQTDKNSFDFINGNNLKLAKEKSVSDIGQGLKRNAQSTTSAPAPMQQPDDESDSEKGKKITSQNQMQKQVERGQAPKEIDRVDKPHQKGQQNHVHFKDGTSLNQDGSIHDAHKGIPNPSNTTKTWLQNNGWSLGQ